MVRLGVTPGRVVATAELWLKQCYEFFLSSLSSKGLKVKEDQNLDPIQSCSYMLFST